MWREVSLLTLLKMEIFYSLYAEQLTESVLYLELKAIETCFKI